MDQLAGFMSDEVLHFAETAEREWFYQSALPEGNTEFRIIGPIVMGWEVWTDGEDEKTSAPVIFKSNEKSKALQEAGNDKNKRLSWFLAFAGFLTDKKVVRPFKINSKDIIKEMTKIQSDHKPKQIYGEALCCISKTKASGGQTPWKYGFALCMSRDAKGAACPLEYKLSAEDQLIVEGHPIDVEAAFRGDSPYL